MKRNIRTFHLKHQNLLPNRLGFFGSGAKVLPQKANGVAQRNSKSLLSSQRVGSYLFREKLLSI